MDSRVANTQRSQTKWDGIRRRRPLDSMLSSPKPRFCGLISRPPFTFIFACSPLLCRSPSLSQPGVPLNPIYTLTSSSKPSQLLTTGPPAPCFLPPPNPVIYLVSSQDSKHLGQRLCLPWNPTVPDHTVLINWLFITHSIESIILLV